MGPVGVAVLTACLSAGILAVGVINTYVTTKDQERKALEQKEQDAQTIDMLKRQLANTDEALATLTGGDSFCYLRALNYEPGALKLFLAKHGKHPMYDVVVLVDVRQGPPTDLRHVVIDRVVHLGFDTTVRPELVFPDNLEDFKFEITVDGRNGGVKEMLIIKHVPGGKDASGKDWPGGAYHRALIVFRLDEHRRPTGDPLMKEVDYGFPGGDPFPDLAAVGFTPVNDLGEEAAKQKVANPSLPGDTLVP